MTLHCFKGKGMKTSILSIGKKRRRKRNFLLEWQLNELNDQIIFNSGVVGWFAKQNKQNKTNATPPPPKKNTSKK